MVGDPADGLLRHRGAVDLGEVRGDLTSGQPVGIQRQDDLIDPAESALPLLYDHRLKGPLPVAGDLDLDALGELLEQPVRPGQGQSLLLGQPDQLNSGKLLSRGLRLLLRTHNIQCRHHGTSPPGSQPSASGRKHR
jgi:hypothetical protein